MASSLFNPDAFEGDWYGWLTNQTSHIGLGVFLVFVLSMSAFAIDGEFPVRLHMFLLIAAFYVLFIELYLQGWRGFDTIEDSVFVIAYGAAAPLSSSIELEAGRSVIIMDLGPMLPYFYVCIAHMVAGVAWRIAQK